MASLSTEKNSSSKETLDYTSAALRIKFIIPLVSFIIILILILSIGLFYIETSSQSYNIFHERFSRTKSIVGEFYTHSVESNANAIRAIIAGLKLNKDFASLFAAGNRDAILEYTAPLYKELNHDYNITHFYFTGPDRVNILRVHAPLRFGDTINRKTTLEAQSSKTISHGIELGVFGTLTLRVVRPWYANDGKLIGYLELGMEVDHIINRIQKIFGFDVGLFVQKKYLEKEAWKVSGHIFNRKVDWDRFDTLVPTRQPEHLVFHDFINKREHNNESFDDVMVSYDDFWVLSIPITDVQDRKVANLLMLTDTTLEVSVLKRTIITVGVTIFILAGVLLALFSRQLNKVSKHIKHDEDLLRQMASKDPLTKLYTRRIFNEHLKAEINYSKRFKTKTSLLFIDIDHFKQVNDIYGHLAGDAILRELSKRILSSSRDTDIACRFGGEEFAVIAKNTGSTTTEVLAERIRQLVEATPFDAGKGEMITVTVSIGIATYPDHAGSDTDLIEVADIAMYTAKEGGRNCVRISRTSTEG